MTVENGNGKKKIVCPKCSKKRAETGKGIVGNVFISLGHIAPGENSGTKVVFCPVCKYGIKYRQNDKGKIEII